MIGNPFQPLGWKGFFLMGKNQIATPTLLVLPYRVVCLDRNSVVDYLLSEIHHDLSSSYGCLPIHPLAVCGYNKTVSC